MIVTVTTGELDDADDDGNRKILTGASAAGQQIVFAASPADYEALRYAAWWSPEGKTLAAVDPLDALDEP